MITTNELRLALSQNRMEITFDNNTYLRKVKGEDGYVLVERDEAGEWQDTENLSKRKCMQFAIKRFQLKNDCDIRIWWEQFH